MEPIVEHQTEINDSSQNERRMSVAQDAYDALRRHPLQDATDPYQMDSTIQQTDRTEDSTNNNTTTTTTKEYTNKLKKANILAFKKKSKKKNERRLKKESHQRLYGSKSTGNIEETMQFNRDQRLIDGPSAAETIMERSMTSESMKQLFSGEPGKKKKKRKKKKEIKIKRKHLINSND